MEKYRNIMIYTFCFFIIGFKLSFADYIYDENLKTLYIGGENLEILRYNVDQYDSTFLNDKIFAINLDDNSDKLLFSVKKSKVTHYELSSKDYIAVTILKINEKKNIYKTELYIIDKKGMLIKKINKAVNHLSKKYFSWSPNEEKIAYIKGDLIVEGRKPFKPEGVYIYDIKKDKTNKISDKGVDLRWSKHDNNIYIQNNFKQKNPTDISVYNTNTNILSKSDKKGMIFSDDGKYYISIELLKDIGPVFRYFIYDNKTNKKIYKFTGDQEYMLESAFEYFFIKNTRMLYIRNIYGYKIFNADTKKLNFKTKSKVLGFNKNMTKAVIYENGIKKIHIDSLMTGKRLFSIKIPTKEKN